uniref:Putative terminase n=1 Tax=viral metagenome TaxID=1070528 RepID=A0A6M3K0K6_9ZZZZ
MVTATKEVVVKTTKVFDAIIDAFNEGKRGILLEGGTYSGKTYGALQALITIAQVAKQTIDINIVSETIPHLKGGCIRDFFKIMGQLPDGNPCYNKSDRIYHEPRWKGVLTFLSADNEKALGMRRDILFINEGDTLYWETARELISRTHLFTIIDWNPRSEFWAHEYYLNDPKWAYNHSTYLDALDVIPIDKAEEIRDLGQKDPNYHNIYELGILGKIEGLVFPKFEQVKELPDGPYFYGLDYGFAHDPTVLVKNVVIVDSLYSHQVFYDDSALTNDDIARKFKEHAIPGNVLIQADPTEPKSAEELRRLGYNVQAIDKAYANTSFGIKQVNAYHQYWTEDSLECIKEQRNCRYIKKREPGTGRVYLSDDITHQWSHGMKARMYAVATYTPASSSGGIIRVGF